uniref:Transmembrane protein n=1 Tax=Vespula pensylvanica TaxID=30213 RepID=A0A834MY71_VESPE|nr:hypothetical protein H0235_017961 [Vespula pensylvanica]
MMKMASNDGGNGAGDGGWQLGWVTRKEKSVPSGVKWECQPRHIVQTITTTTSSVISFWNWFLMSFVGCICRVILCICLEYKRPLNWSVGWLFGWLFGWLVGWLVG